ncbi:hypothetical protein [Bacteroides sp.]|uniref:hypothetical protein n=1 Tax=Bacteroides sp. TaxID=29523 RepID=UPI0026238805|nr:hypothetical protein [Bacteroides sp.]MDD3039901.1 hypothetical protein [Bacteroides sp.]
MKKIDVILITNNLVMSDIYVHSYLQLVIRATRAINSSLPLVLTLLALTLADCCNSVYDHYAKKLLYIRWFATAAEYKLHLDSA